MAEQAEQKAVTQAASSSASPAQSATGAKNKGGRPKTEINWEVLQALCIAHCTLWEIADYFKCSVDSVQRAVKRQFKVSFAVYYRQMATAGKVSIRRKQFQTAMGDGRGAAAMQIWLGKVWLNQRESVEVSGPGGSPIPLEIEAKDRPTLEREIEAFFSRVSIAERIRRGAAPLLNGEGAQLHPPASEETGEAEG